MIPKGYALSEASEWDTRNSLRVISLLMMPSKSDGSGKSFDCLAGGPLLRHQSGPRCSRRGHCLWHLDIRLVGLSNCAFSWTTGGFLRVYQLRRYSSRADPIRYPWWTFLKNFPLYEGSAVSLEKFVFMTGFRHLVVCRMIYLSGRELLHLPESLEHGNCWSRSPDAVHPNVQAGQL